MLNLEREKEILSNEKERDNSSIQDENPRRPGNPVLLGSANKCLDQSRRQIGSWDVKRFFYPSNSDRQIIEAGTRVHTRVFTVFYTGNDNRDYQSQLRNKIYVGNNLAARSRSHEYARGPRGINRSNTHAHTRVHLKMAKVRGGAKFLYHSNVIPLPCPCLIARNTCVYRLLI